MGGWSETGTGAPGRKADCWTRGKETWEGRKRGDREKGAGVGGGVGSAQVRGACGANRGRPHPVPRPQTSLLLLLLLSPGLRGSPDCSFSHSPISSTFKVTIRKLVRARSHRLRCAFLRPLGLSSPL